MAMLILLILLIFFAALGVPLAFAIGASCVSYIATNVPNFMGMIPQRVWNGAFSELMIAMPLFASSISAVRSCGPSAAGWARSTSWPP